MHPKKRKQLDTRNVFIFLITLSGDIWAQHFGELVILVLFVIVSYNIEWYLTDDGCRNQVCKLFDCLTFDWIWSSEKCEKCEDLSPWGNPWGTPPLLMCHHCFRPSFKQNQLKLKIYISKHFLKTCWRYSLPSLQQCPLVWWTQPPACRKSPDHIFLHTSLLRRLLMSHK